MENSIKHLSDVKLTLLSCAKRYYESVALFLHGAGFFVSALNPLVFKDYQDGITVRRVKTDKVDAAKIARFALDNWEVLREYTPMDTTRYVDSLFAELNRLAKRHVYFEAFSTDYKWRVSHATLFGDYTEDVLRVQMAGAMPVAMRRIRSNKK